MYVPCMPTNPAGHSALYKHGTRIAVIGLSPSTRNTDLQQAFGDFGHIIRIEIKQRKGYLEFEAKRDAMDAAEAMDGKRLGDSTIQVQLLTAAKAPGPVNEVVDGRGRIDSGRHGRSPDRKSVGCDRTELRSRESRSSPPVRNHGGCMDSRETDRHRSNGGRYDDDDDEPDRCRSNRHQDAAAMRLNAASSGMHAEDRKPSRFRGDACDTHDSRSRSRGRQQGNKSGYSRNALSEEDALLKRLQEERMLQAWEASEMERRASEEKRREFELASEMKRRELEMKRRELAGAKALGILKTFDEELKEEEGQVTKIEEELVKECVSGEELTKFRADLSQIESKCKQLGTKCVDDVDTGDLVGIAEESAEEMKEDILKRLEDLFGKLAKCRATIQEKVERNRRKEEKAARIAKQLDNAKALDGNISKQLRVLDMIKAKQLAKASLAEVRPHVQAPACAPVMQTIPRTETKKEADVEMPGQPVDDTPRLVMEIPRSQIGVVIGQRGESLNEIRKLSESTIEVHEIGNFASGIARVIMIGGNPEVAQNLIFQKLREKFPHLFGGAREASRAG